MGKTLDPSAPAQDNKKPQSADIHSGPGFRIRRYATRVRSEMIDQFCRFPTADISDQMNRMYTFSPEIRNLTETPTIAGPACTVKVYPGDNLMVHKALDLAHPGDVIVVDTGGARTTAVLGDLVAQKAKHRGIAGFVVDGLIRDLPGIIETGLPVFAAGVTPVGPLHRGPGEINYPICCGGVVVTPGDLIFGDENGIVLVQEDFAQCILSRLRGQQAAMDAYVEKVKQGIFSNDWADRILRDADCEVSDVDG